MLGPAARPGLHPPDAFSGELLFLGVALFVAIGALSHEEERPFSASIVYLGLGLLASAGIRLFGLGWIHPFRDAAFVEHLTEIALIVALFASGLRVKEGFSSRRRRDVALLLAAVMPATIAAVALFGVAAMGLPFGAALLLGAMLAPTDPVLAGAVGLGPPGEEGVESDARFNLTIEASANDALAAPFVLAGFFVVERGGAGWLAEWALADVLYAVVVAVAAGGAAGYGMAALAERMRRRDLLHGELDGFLVIGIVLVVYGAVNVIDAYGFLAVFAAGIGFRRYEVGHDYNRRAHDGAQVAENFLELAVILLLGSLVTVAALGEPGLAGWLLAPLLIVVIRPAAVLAFLSVSETPLRERLFIGAFGVKGVASVYYAAVVLGEGLLPAAEARTVFWTVAVAVMLSVVVHGASASALARRLLER